jgi:uncharacterized protein YeaO (DUF488 family)
LIRHASVYELRKDPRAGDAGLRVLVMRRWPRGIRKDQVDLWLKDAAPSRALLDEYNHPGLAWDEFERRYRAEILEQRPTVVDQLRQLERDHETVTLLCFERIPPAEHCHRVVLSDILARAQSP